MRPTAVSLALLGLLAALPASGLTIVAGESVVAIDRSVSLRVNDLSDQTILAFSVLDVGGSGPVTLSRRVLSWVGTDVHLVSGRLVGGGSISISGGLVSHASVFRLTPVSLGGIPVSPAPIPEPTSALLFAAGTGLVVAWLRRLRA
jgi:hypothetical protein